MRSLSEAGRSASEALAKSLSDLGLVAVYSSPYQRAVETVEPLAKRLELPIREIADLRERALGSISDIPFEQAIAASFADFDLQYPGGESSRRVQERAVRAIERLIEAHPTDPVAIATHGNLISLLFNAYDRDVGFDFWQSLCLPDVFQLRLSPSGDVSFKRVAEYAA
jgi:2,3-bisphosphoglycerate-dependent phosphoglycerate mutase